MTRENIAIREAQSSDIPMIVELLKYIAYESNSSDIFDEAHSWKHVTGIICDGVSFIATSGQSIVGVVMCGYIDMAFVQTPHLETHHLYVLPAARNTPTTRNLLKAAEKYADKHGIVLIFHQMDYQSAINGSVNNSGRVERLFKSRGYEGPVDIATVDRERRRVGVSYKYVGKPDVDHKPMMK